jgi:hypothetical protein
VTPADAVDFADIVTGFAELKGKQLSKPALKLFWNSMQHWDMEDFRQAANQLIRTCDFMPTPKDFEELRKAGRPTAGEAWADIRAMARQSYTAQPDDPIAARALQALGGLRAVAMCDSDKVHFLERRFAEHFESIQDSEDIREAVPQIAYSSGPRRLSGPASAADVLGRLGHEVAKHRD